MYKRLASPLSLLSFLAFFLPSGIAISDGVKPVQKVAVYETNVRVFDSDSIKIEFDSDQSTPPVGTLARIDNFISSTNRSSKVESYIIAAWADFDVPETGDLSEHQSNLADDRAKAIKAAFEHAGVTKIDTYEMTRKPNWLHRLFSTKTAEVEGSAMNLRSTDDDLVLIDIGKRLRVRGGPRTVVVIAKFKNEFLTH